MDALDATNCRFHRIKKRLGMKYSLCSLRYPLRDARRDLMNGVNCITVSTLIGHSDLGPLAKTYRHIAQCPVFMACAVAEDQTRGDAVAQVFFVARKA